MANLGKTLLQRKDINLIQLNLALDFMVFYGGRLGTNLLELGVISEETLANALSQSLGLPPCHQRDLENVPPEVLKTYSPQLAFRTQSVPFRKVGKELYVTMIDPRNELAQNEIRRTIGGPVLFHVTPELRIHIALEKYFMIRMDARMRALSSKVRGFSGPVRRTPVFAQDDLDISFSKPKDLPPIVPSTTDGWVTDDQPKRSAPAVVVPKKSTEKVALSIQKLAFELEEAKSRDEIAELCLTFSQRFLKRVVLFVLKKDVGFGWDGRGEGLTREKVKSIVIPLNEPSVFQTLLESQGHLLGPLAPTAVNVQFQKALGEVSPPNALLLPLTIGGITFGAIYGDNGEQPVASEGINELQVMVSRANIAFERLIVAERKKALALGA